VLTLRLNHSVTEDGHRVQVDLEDGATQQSATSYFSFLMSEQDREDVRWYLEDYLEYPVAPAPTIAARVERRLAELGLDLFAKLFPVGSDARAIWDRVNKRISETRVEVVPDLMGLAEIPWELLRTPRSNAAVALQSHSFVRTQGRPVAQPRSLELAPRGSMIRVLLVICRPGNDEDVPFRSVARHLAEQSIRAPHAFKVDVLRPPTIEHLELTLRSANDQGKPYHVVHFDGHGLYRKPRSGGNGRGFLVFEAPGTKHNRHLVDGFSIGSLLEKTGVPVLVLNACRSAYTEIATRPRSVSESSNKDMALQVGAYGSLAHEAVAVGVKRTFRNLG